MHNTAHCKILLTNNCMKTKNSYAPSYVSEKQVIDCVSNLLGIRPEECKAELTLAIGWNGEKYITSTDWHVSYPGGQCIFPTCASPQHKTFIAAVCGYITVEGKGLEPISTAHEFLQSNDKIEFLEGDYPRFRFNPGEPLEIAFDERGSIIFNDCDVIVETHGISRIFTIQNGKGTVYAHFTNGILSK